ncbi:hypothetical protein BCR43DRAFT_85080 [Syncephalastrum racemosum]|uniref:Uncharacterized protein n=1 Tax=Syncephalastrum racemosum TaxID=13706 RepID=A0A1X2H3A3_SYNRA|nr:hypothetical protein BCR43DRAFT_85080 [Syncephalastrum racemosum]
MHSQPPRQSWMQRPVGNRSAENPEFLTHAPRIHHQSSTVSRRTVLERQRQPRFPPSIQGSATGRSMSDSSPGRDPILQSRIQQLQEELSFCRDEWVIVCIILSLLRSSFYSVKAQSPRSVAASAAAPLSLDPQSASLKSEENDPPGVRVLESRTNVPMSSSTLQREGGRATPPPPELFATTIPDLRSEHFVPEYDFTAFKTSTFLVARASQRQPSTSQHSRSKCKTKRKKKQHPTRKQEEQQASSSTRETGIQQEMSNAIKHDLERELLMAYDDLWLQIRNLEAKIERVEEMIRRMITSNGMTPPSEGL